MKLSKNYKKIASGFLFFCLLFVFLIQNVNIFKADDAQLGIDMESAFNNWTPISAYSNGSMQYPGKWSYNTSGKYVIVK